MKSRSKRICSSGSAISIISEREKRASQGGVKMDLMVHAEALKEICRVMSALVYSAQ